MVNDPGRILAVDPGQKRIGLALSDPTRTIVSPFDVLPHRSPAGNAREILGIAADQGVTLILVGQPLHWDGEPSRQAAASQKLAQALREEGSIPVLLVDEYGSTQEAQSIRRQMDVSREKRSGHLDDLAAAVILQNYLDLQESEGSV